ncbi:MAG: hypothetical protein QOD57_1001, partial [Actinomycetota bacterium]|nr:hypothetical protein [Actinomycetota bacterium]
AVGVAPPDEEVQVALAEPVQGRRQPARVHPGPGRAGGNGGDIEQEAHRGRV